MMPQKRRREAFLCAHTRASHWSYDMWQALLVHSTRDWDITNSSIRVGKEMYNEVGVLHADLNDLQKRGVHFPKGQFTKNGGVRVLKYTFALLRLGAVPEKLRFGGSPTAQLSEDSQKLVREFEKDHRDLDILVVVSGFKEWPKLDRFVATVNKISDEKYKEFIQGQANAASTNDSHEQDVGSMGAVAKSNTSSGHGGDGSVAEESGASQKRKRPVAEEPGGIVSRDSEQALESKQALLRVLRKNGYGRKKEVEDCDKAWMKRIKEKVVATIEEAYTEWEKAEATAAYSKKAMTVAKD